MILSVSVQEKSFGDKMLYHDLQFSVQENEKVGLIGRNGTGKTTLFGIIAGTDQDYDGEVILKKGSILVSGRQEHHGFEHKTVLEYLQGDLPDYAELAEIIDNYPETMGDNQHKIQIYSDALHRFADLGYYQLEDDIAQALEVYQLDHTLLHRPLDSLSGGQLRMVELIKIQRSRGHIVLIDEPTNHMDYVAKEAFLKWMKSAQESVLVITHDRDVLQNVDRIVEIRDGKAFDFSGNYDDYLRTNTNQMTSQVNEFDISRKRIRNLEEAVIRFRRLKEKSRDPGTIRRFKSQEQKAADELKQLQSMEKPSFWIDQDSAATMPTKLANSYHKYKAKNIQIQTKTKDSGLTRLLLEVDKLSLGYEEPLFEDINFRLHEGERIRLHGRNGAGKTTLVAAVLAASEGVKPPSSIFKGIITVEETLTIGLYDQEIDPRYLSMTLGAAVEQALRDINAPVNTQRVKQLLGNYLFDPISDIEQPVSRLSGGQKARFQLIRMLAGEPMMLILDEPTNHLDLPSIEELEAALLGYKGAILYISHDSYFAGKLGGQTVSIGS